MTDTKPKGIEPETANKMQRIQQSYERRLARQKDVIDRLQTSATEARQHAVIELRDKFAKDEDWNAVSKLEAWFPEFIR